MNQYFGETDSNVQHTLKNTTSQQSSM